MTTLYVINLLSNADGCHIVHKYGCLEFPNNFYELGLFESCTQAVQSAKELLPKATCCSACVTACNDPEHHTHEKFKKSKIFNIETE